MPSKTHTETTHTITSLLPAEFDVFLEYLNSHLADNGNNGQAYFQPLSRDASRFPTNKAEAFKTGMRVAVGAAGWRRVWVVRDAGGRIVGHIDLRAHGERFATHRCLLGMGVQRGHRQLGLGGRLVAHAEQWAIEAGFAWIDLQVLSVNAPAIKLYERAVFQKTGEIPDMFRIDGLSFSYTSMSKCLG